MNRKLQWTPALRRRVAMCIIGNIILGLGVALTKLTAFGNDPFNGMCMAVSARIGIPYAVYTPIFNLALFGLELLFGRKYIHIGTFVNWFLLCYAVSFFLWIGELFGVTVLSGMALRLAVLVIGLIVISFGLALYQRADLGVAPYDAIPLMVCDRWPRVPFFWARIALVGLCTVVGWLAGGIVGIGTLLTALALGPVVDFFMRRLDKRLGVAP